MSPDGAAGLTVGFRRWIHNPEKILGRQIREGMTVLEFGCGPGYFTPEIARMVGSTGKVIAVDVQEEMLQLLRDRIHGLDVEKRITPHKSGLTSIGVTEKADYAIAFLVMHEVPDKRKTLEEIRSLLKPNGRLYIMEMITHPPKSNYEETVRIAKDVGFVEAEKPRFILNRGIIFSKGN